MKEVKGRDCFGNEYEETIYDDGRVKRCTQTSRKNEFEFMGDTYSWDCLYGLSSLKDYVDEYHQEIRLYRDKYGRLLLYFYDEYMNFSNGDDREDYLWVVVENEDDADKMAGESRLGRLRTPYIAADEKQWMAAHQYVKREE